MLLEIKRYPKGDYLMLSYRIFMNLSCILNICTTPVSQNEINANAFKCVGHRKQKICIDCLILLSSSRYDLVVL